MSALRVSKSASGNFRPAVGRRAALAPAPLSPGLAGGGGSSAEGGAAVRLAGGGSGSGPRVGCARYGQLGLRRASGRPSPPLSGVRCAALGLARFGAATDERLASEGWRTQAWPPMLGGHLIYSLLVSPIILTQYSELRHQLQSEYNAAASSEKDKAAR